MIVTSFTPKSGPPQTQMKQGHMHKKGRNQTNVGQSKSWKHTHIQSLANSRNQG
jgi:hypothetical protein